jgi:hypothetical protein
MRDILAFMEINENQSILMKGSEVVRMLCLGGTAGYRLLKHWERERILLPVKLPALKSLRYRRDEVEAICNNKEEIPCGEFNVQQKI